MSTIDERYTTVEYLSVIALSLIHPIVRLVEKIAELPPSEPNPVQVSGLENGYSAAVILLSGVVVESALARTNRVDGICPGSNHFKPLDFFKEQFPECSDLYEYLSDLFVARDVVAHSHLWTAEVVTGPDGKLDFVDEPCVLPGYTDKKYEKRVDQETRTTRRLGINVFPPKIGREDVSIVLDCAFRILEFLENQDKEYFTISSLPVQFNGKSMRFPEFIAAAKSPGFLHSSKILSKAGKGWACPPFTYHNNRNTQ